MDNDGDDAYKLFKIFYDHARTHAFIVSTLLVFTVGNYQFSYYRVGF